jgi:hypothetical protein
VVPIESPDSVFSVYLTAPKGQKVVRRSIHFIYRDGRREVDTARLDGVALAATSEASALRLIRAFTNAVRICRARRKTEAF